MASKLQLLKGYLRRSAKYLGEQTSELASLNVAFPKEKSLFQFKSRDDLNNWVLGTDADVGGQSEASLGITENGTALFSGSISTQLPPGSKVGKTGYAAIRSRNPDLTFFHKEYVNLVHFQQLAIRCRGDSRQYMVNISTDNPFPAYLHQHLLLLKTPGQWETVFLDLDRFNVTAYGYTQKRQWAMAKEKIKTIGISIVRQPGPFCLEVESIRACNGAIESSGEAS